MDSFFVVSTNINPCMKTCLAFFLISIQSICPVFSQSPGLTAVFDSKRNNVSIKWQHKDTEILQYVLERSADNFTWNEIYHALASNLTKDKIAKFTDQKAGTGKSYYRLKVIRSFMRACYSIPIMVIIGKPGNNWLMYPVPVSDILNLQYNGSEIIPGVISVFIRTVKGQILTRLRMASTSRLIQIPVDNLGRGIYDIQIVIRDEVVWNQRFVK